MRNLMFTYVVRNWISILGFLTQVYQVPKKPKSLTLLISHLQTLNRFIFFLALLFSAEDSCSDSASELTGASPKLNIRN
ncbi:hypothetical protein Hanom_Chr13g01207081 [Helianthus anomalus]